MYSWILLFCCSMHAYTDRYTIIDQLKGYYSFTAITQEFVPPHNIMKYIIV